MKDPLDYLNSFENRLFFAVAKIFEDFGDGKNEEEIREKIIQIAKDMEL